MDDAERVVVDLFCRYARKAAGIRRRNGRRRRDRRCTVAAPRRIADFIAGMTDRYALVEHARLFDSTPELR